MAFFSDDFGLRSPPVILETIFAKKRYTLMPLFATILGQGAPPVIQKPFSPKNGIPYHLYLRRLWVKEPPRHSEIIFAKKRYTLIYLFPTILG